MSEVLNLFGPLGIGAIIGIIIQHLLERKQGKQTMIFEARVRAYAGITGRIFNLFQEIDVQRLPDEMKFTKINELLSDTSLLASHELAELIGEFQGKIYKFHVLLREKKDVESEKLHTELTNLACKIHDQMRRDLFIDNKTLFNKG